jgi:hypothetical protein
MPCDESDEDNCGRHETPGADQVAGKCEPGDQADGDSNDQAAVSNENESFLEEVALIQPALMARRILLYRSHPSTINRELVG